MNLHVASVKLHLKNDTQTQNKRVDIGNSSNRYDALQDERNEETENENCKINNEKKCAEVKAGDKKRESCHARDTSVEALEKRHRKS